MDTKQKMFAVALLGSMLVPALAGAQDKKPEDGDKVPCWGVNKCKGTGACGANGCRSGGCHGHNTCKATGFLRIDPETCLKIVDGRLTKEVVPAAPAKK